MDDSGNERKLRTLLDALDLHAASCGALRGRERSERAASILPLPTVHGVAQAYHHLRPILEDGRLRPRAPEQAPRHYHELELTGRVFTCLGVLYPNREVAFIFNHRCEGAHATAADASPWDSGLFWKTFNATDTAEARRDAFQRHTLQAPYFRSYLAEHLVVCFSSPDDYIALHPPVRPDPLGFVDPINPMTYLCEVRHVGELALEDGALLAVVLPSSYEFDDDLNPSLAMLRLQGIHIETYPGREPTAAQHGVRRWVQRWLHEPRAAGGAGW